MMQVFGQEGRWDTSEDAIVITEAACDGGPEWRWRDLRCIVWSMIGHMNSLEVVLIYFLHSRFL